LNEEVAYHLAGKLIATIHSQYHSLTGTVSLISPDTVKDNIRVDPAKCAGQGISIPESSTDMRVATEKAVLEISGYESELIHRMIDAPDSREMEAREAEERVLAMVRLRASEMDLSSKEIVAQALRLVTHHWYEVWNLADHLRRSEKRTLGAAELQKVVQDIGSGHQRFLQL
jgi:hypothetical protein